MGLYEERSKDCATLAQKITQDIHDTIFGSGFKRIQLIEFIETRSDGSLIENVGVDEQGVYVTFEGGGDEKYMVGFFSIPTLMALLRGTERKVQQLI